MRKSLLLLALVALFAGCSSNPLAPENDRSPTPASECTTDQGQPC